MVVRELTEDEYAIYAGSATLAIELIPSFRDAIALLRPFTDDESPVVYVDPYSRICLSMAFFKRSRYQRATTVLHEAMHILNRHFERSEAFGMNNPTAFLVGADFEIGTTLVDHPRADTSHQIVPDRDPYEYEPHLTFEQYYSILNGQDEDDENTGGDSGEEGQEGGGGPEEDQDSEGSAPSETSGDSGEDDAGDGEGNGAGDSPSEEIANQSGCGQASQSDIEAADREGIERASDAEEAVARNNTEARLRQDADKARRAGNSHMGAFLDRITLMLRPPKADWKKIVNSAVNKANSNIARGRTDFTYRRPNKKLQYDSFVFPGMQTYIPTLAFGIDTSGSMGDGDYSSTLSEADAVLRNSAAAKSGLTVFAIDTKISGKIQKVKSIKDVEFHGGGGTDMGPAFTFVRKMRRENRPDIFVLATDGGVPWGPVIKELYLCRKLFKSIILITDEASFLAVPEELHSLATVIDIS